VVSPQGVPRLIGLTEAIDRLLPSMPDGLTEWDFFDLNEIEMLDPAFNGTLDLAKLIADKKADPFGRPRSVTNYLYFTNRDLFRAKESLAAVTSDPWISAVQQQAAEWGLRRE
jgi:hypothetical protein